MAGRRRRPSNSTVATVEETTLRPKRESSMLKRVPKRKGEDEWPTFVLTDAVVYRLDGTTLGNPLLVDTEGPFIIRGHLDVDEKEKEARLVKPSVKSAYIEVVNSKRYAIGWPAAFWMSGEAGWYEIRPSQRYASKYSDIIEAITLYYEIMDVCEAHDELVSSAQVKRKGKKTRAPPLTVDNIFLKYALAVGDGIFIDEVVARCDKWAQFFILHFSKETQYTWTNNPFQKWVLERHPDIREKLALAASKPFKPDNTTQRARSLSARTGRSNSDAEDITMSDAPPSGKTKGKGRSHDSRDRRVSTPVQNEDENTTSVVSKFIGILDEILADAKDPNKVDERTIRGKMYFKCKVTTYDRPTEMAKYFSNQLLERLGPHWRPTPFFRWLNIVSKEEPGDLPQNVIDSFPSNVAHRDKKGRGSKAASAPTAALRSPTESLGGQSDGSESEQEMRQGKRPHGGRTSGKMSALRPRKRVASEMDVEESPTSNRRGSKSAKRIHINDDETDDSDIAISGDEEVEGLATPNNNSPVRLLLHAEEIPSMSPTGPNGTWMCQEENCNYIVRSAGDEEGKQLIEAHFKEHERQVQRLNLAVEEGTRGRNPIDHLIEKIQAMRNSAAQNASRELDGALSPVPIKRRLLI